MIVADSLVRRGFFPKELPPPFRSSEFADFLRQEKQFIATAPEGAKQLISRPCNHNLARPGQLRRRIQIWNPFSYQILASILEDGADDISRHLAGSVLSITKPVIDDEERRALLPQTGGGALPEIRAGRRATGRVLLRTDISRFYHSIYTHSIPWAMLGKADAKANRKSGLGNEIDRALRNGQDGQTLGIPVGPDASLVIAEIVACAVDKPVQAALLRGFRFIDDYEVAFDSRAEAESALVRLEEALGEFELALNPRKTSIDALPQPLDTDWVLAIRQHEFQGQQISGKELLRYFNLVFALQRTMPTDPIISYAIGRLAQGSVDATDWELFQNLLFQCAVVEPASMPFVLSQLQRHQELGLSSALADVIDKILQAHSPLGHASEVAWALWTAITLGITLPDSAAQAVALSDDPVVALLMLDARDKAVFEEDPDISKWQSRLTSEELYDRNWLFVYESLRKGWLTPPVAGSPVGADPNFAALEASGVSFYESEPQDDATEWFPEDSTGYD